jgi:UDP-N-acetylmuramate--alanine ligase
MTAHVLREAGQKPSHYVGAEIPILGANAKWSDDGEYMVAEGDESDGTLALYRPEHSVILNIEAEHLGFLSRTSITSARVFTKLADQTTGKLVYCAEDPVASRTYALTEKMRFPTAGKMPTTPPPICATLKGSSAFTVDEKGRGAG